MVDQPLYKALDQGENICSVLLMLQHALTLPNGDHPYTHLLSDSLNASFLISNLVDNALLPLLQ